VLDEDEFAALPLEPSDRQAARAALAEMQALAARRAGPFFVLSGPGPSRSARGSAPPTPPSSGGRGRTPDEPTNSGTTP
jgi:hypothetical protein